jgi:hypothetical protein
VTTGIDRRAHDRFAVLPMYTAVRARRLDSEKFEFEGHAYDVSVGGVRFELDEGIDPGTAIALEIELPESAWRSGRDTGPGRGILVVGNVVWADDSEPGPVKMALAVSRFARAGDRARLESVLTSGIYRKAA